jgi:hypothetical protein
MVINVEVTGIRALLNARDCPEEFGHEALCTRYGGGETTILAQRV